MLIWQKGPLGISLIIREDFNVYVDFGFKPDPWIYQIVSNVILFLLFLILFFGCVLFLVVILGCVLFFGPKNPPVSLPARRDKHFIPRYVVPWAMSSSMVMPFLVIPSCFSAPTDKLEENKGFVLNLFWSGKKRRIQDFPVVMILCLWEVSLLCMKTESKCVQEMSCHESCLLL